MIMLKVSVFIESVILGVGASNRGGSCAILVLESSVIKNPADSYRKVITRYDGQGVKQGSIVANIAQQVADAITVQSFVLVRSSSAEPRGIETGLHAWTWKRIPEASEGWQMRASFAAWEIALGGQVTPEILELAASAPADVPKDMVIHVGTSGPGFRRPIYRSTKPAGRRATKGVRALLAGSRGKD